MVLRVGSINQQGGYSTAINLPIRWQTTESLSNDHNTTLWCVQFTFPCLCFAFLCLFFFSPFCLSVGSSMKIIIIKVYVCGLRSNERSRCPWRCLCRTEVRPVYGVSTETERSSDLQWCESPFQNGVCFKWTSVPDATVVVLVLSPTSGT